MRTEDSYARWALAQAAKAAKRIRQHLQAAHHAAPTAASLALLRDALRVQRCIVDAVNDADPPRSGLGTELGAAKIAAVVAITRELLAVSGPLVTTRRHK